MATGGPEANQVISELQDLGARAQEGVKTEEITVLGDPIFNFYYPNGADIGTLLDPDHMPAVTTFETVVLLPGLARLRGKHPNLYNNNIYEFVGKSQRLQTISRVARYGRGYDRWLGQDERREYLNAMTASMGELIAQNPNTHNAAYVPVERAGGNIARALDLPCEVSLEAKRLRFRDNPDLLGVGVNLPSNVESLRGRPVVLIEAFLASGSTGAGIALALKNRGIVPPQMDCYAVVACPAGGYYLDAVRQALGDLNGSNLSVFAGGELNQDWYVVYSQDDPLLRQHPGVALSGWQVGGDAGDLTTL